MNKLSYSIIIRGAKEEVWNTLLDPESYQRWAKAFSPDSTSEGVWKEGERILFWDPRLGGTTAIIEQLRPFELVHLNHINTVTKDRVAETTGGMTEKWIGTQEIYRLTEVDGPDRT